MLIISSHLPVSCRYLIDWCGSLGFVSQRFNYFSDKSMGKVNKILVIIIWSYDARSWLGKWFWHSLSFIIAYNVTKRDLFVVLIHSVPLSFFSFVTHIINCIVISDNLKAMVFRNHINRWYGLHHSPSV